VRRVEGVLGMNVRRDRVEETITIDQKDESEDIVKRVGMNDCTPALTLGPEHSLNQPEKNLLGDEGKRRHQSIVGATMYLAHLSRHDILNAVNQLARGMSKPSRAHMVVAKHLLRYLPGPTTSSITSRENLSSPPSQMPTGVIPQTTANQHRTSSCSRTAQ